MRESVEALLNGNLPINAPTLFIEELNSCSTSGRSPGLVPRRSVGLRLISVRPSRYNHAVVIKETETFKNITVAEPRGIHTRFPILPLPQRQRAPEVKLKEPIKALKIYQATGVLSITMARFGFYTFNCNEGDKHPLSRRFCPSDTDRDLFEVVAGIFAH